MGVVIFLLTDSSKQFRMRLMKVCPECSAQYDNSVNFCANDGRSLTQKTVTDTRLCPHCANSIPADAAKCTYCKAEVEAAPQWPTREDGGLEPGSKTHSQKVPKSAKAALLVGIVLSVIGLVLMGRAILGQESSSETRQFAEEKVKELQDKEQKIQALEGQLAQVRQEFTDSSSQIAALKGKLEENEKELSATRQRLEIASREINRLTTRSAASTSPPPSRPADRAPSPAPLPGRRPAEPGIYEAIRATEVHEDPAASSRIVSQIRKGTKVAVVRSVGEWLEVRSKHGKPPGFISRDDAMFVGRAD